MNRVLIVIDGGVAYPIWDADVNVCILDLDDNPEPTPEDYKGFEDLVPAYLKENENV